MSAVLLKGAVLPDNPSRAVVVSALLTMAVAALSAVAINYATNEGEPPAVLRPLQQWPWASALVLTLTSAAIILLTARSGRAAIAAVTESRRRRDRDDLAGYVRQQWIADLLVPLVAAARWDPVLVERPSAVPPLPGAPIHPEGRPDRPVPPGSSLSGLAESYRHRLVILGDYGTGKTVVLLSLTRDLLDGRGDDDPVPVVLLLSRWARDRRTLARWIEGELAESYGLSRRSARELVRTGQVLPMLDGLDEVASKDRPGCTAAIDAYLAEIGPLVVTCRTATYAAVSPLPVRGAVEVQRLSQQWVADHLDAGGSALAGLRRAVQRDPAFADLMRTPLMLNLAVATYPGGDGAAPPADLDADGLVDGYLTRLLNHRGVVGARRLPDDDMRVRLVRLARYLDGRGTTSFEPDALTADVLATRWHRTLVRPGLAWALGAAGAVLAGGVPLIVSTPPWTLRDFLTSALAGAVAALGLSRFVHADRSGVGAVLHWNPAAVRRRLRRPGLPGAFLAGLAAESVHHAVVTRDAVSAVPRLLVLTVAVLLVGLRAGRSGEPAVPDARLVASRRTVALTWLIVSLAGGGLTALEVTARGWQPLWAADTALTLWIFAACVAALITGLALLLAPASHIPPATTGRWRAATAVLCGGLLAYAANKGLVTWYTFGLPWYLANTILGGHVLVLLGAGTSIARRLGPPASRTAGAFLVVYSAILLMQTVRSTLRDRDEFPMLLVISFLGAGAWLCLRYGGVAWLRQQVIRMLLTRESRDRWPLLAVLHDADNRGLLRRAGGSYLFPHRAVQEHLARQGSVRRQ